MKQTKHFESITDKELKEVADLLLKGEIVGFPTETVYGLGAVIEEESVNTLYELKGRPKEKAMTIHISTLDIVSLYAKDLSEDFYLLAQKFFPGPLTLIVKKQPSLLSFLTADETIAFRMPTHPIAKKLISYAGGAIIATSANLSSKPSLITGKDLVKEFSGKISAIIDDGASTLGISSTVVNLTTTPYKILREGSIKKEELELVLQKPIICL